jgi:hypothetical protein
MGRTNYRTFLQRELALLCVPLRSDYVKERSCAQPERRTCRAALAAGTNVFLINLFLAELVFQMYRRDIELFG